MALVMSGYMQRHMFNQHVTIGSKFVQSSGLIGGDRREDAKVWHNLVAIISSRDEKFNIAQSKYDDLLKAALERNP